MPRIVYSFSNSRGGSQEGQPTVFARIVAGAVAGLLLLVSAFLGFFIFLVIAGVIVIAGIIMAIRLWMFRRKVESAFKRGEPKTPPAADYIDVEYEERDER